MHVCTPAATSPADTGSLQAWLWAFAQQSLDYAILLLGVDLRVQWANPGAGWILAATAAELTGAPLTRFFTDEDRELGIPAFEAALAQRTGSSDDDRWMLRADGARFWAAGRTVAVHNRDGSLRGYVKIFRDLTELKMRLDRLGNQAQALGAENAARAAAIAAVAHQVRDPLASIALASARLRGQGAPTDGTPAGDAAHEAALDSIERNVALAARLVAELQQAQHVDVAQIALNIAPLRLDAELRAALDSAVQRIPRQARQIELLLPPGVPITFEGDPLRLQQVFANLIANAIGSTAADGRIWIHGTVEARQVVVRIEDNGAGIAPAMRESIFELFTQPAELPAGGGSGIGLALVKRIVELHGGTVQAGSAGAGKGSQYSVRLPLRHPPVSPAQASG